MVHWRHGSGASAASKGSAKHSIMMFFCVESQRGGWVVARDLHASFHPSIARGLVGKIMALFSETKWPTLFSRQRENVRKTPLPRRLVR